ncbi:MAG: lipid-binding SYLF domain-containing protein [Atribacterota bacterium]
MNKYLSMLVLVCVLFFSVWPAGADEIKTIDQSLEVLYDLSQVTDNDVFFYLFRRAQAIAVFPNVIRLGLGLGAQFGDGIVYRKELGENTWYGPAFYQIYGLSFGPQAGIQSVGLVLLIMNQQGLDIFYQNTLTVGGNIGVSAGPIGRSFSAEIDIGLKSSIYSYSLSRGLYAGVSIQGAKLKQNRKASRNFYEKNADPQEILSNTISQEPSSLRLKQFLEDLSRRGKE